MRLKRLVLNDFGVYQGKVIFDLSSDEKPIIIFGGKNGAGKTTILESIKLCLYGPRGIGRKVNRKEYEEHIRNRIHRHRNAIVPLNHTSISLSFDYSIFGNEQNYEIIRSWKIKQESFQEQLIIFVNGKLLTNVPEEHWQDYIDDLVPPNIADLFFFDGEKIQTLVIDNFNEQSLSNEVKRLLGLNIVEKLQADLQTYQYKQTKENTVPHLRNKLEEAEKFYKEIDQNYQIKFQEEAHLKSNLENIQGKIEKKELQISLESSGYAFQRDNLKNQLSRTNIELELVEKQLHELTAGLLPFALVPELCRELEAQLIAEGEFQKWQASKSLLEPKIVQIQQTISTDEFWSKANGNLPLPERKGMIKQISIMLLGLIEPKDNQDENDVIHHVSDYERFQLISWIGEIIQFLPDKIHIIGEKIGNLEKTRQDITVKLRNIPEDEVLRPLMENLNQLNQDLGKIKSLISRVTQEKDSLLSQREDAEKQIMKTYENLKSGKRVEDRIIMVEKTQKVLDDFMVEITNRKMRVLENLIVSKFNELSRKPDLVKEVSINPQSFNIQIFDNNNINIPKDLLSAGEKQMFAIALLWALRELSGKPLPVIIDTPLGRLDSDHRSHLIENYFSKVSHQVILFSTDTEIDRVYFEALKPNISRNYHLDYDNFRGKTNVTQGYFWNGGSNEIE